MPSETPTGTVDGVNDTFTLAYAPIVSSLIVLRNGIVQEAGTGNDYTLSGSVITFEAGALPQTGDKVRARYTRQI